MGYICQAHFQATNGLACSGTAQDGVGEALGYHLPGVSDCPCKLDAENSLVGALPGCTLIRGGTCPSDMLLPFWFQARLAPTT